MKRVLASIILIIAAPAFAVDDLEVIALRVLSPSALFVGGGDGQRVGTTDSAVSMEDVRAITNRADVLAAYAAALAAETAPEAHPRGIETPVVVIQSVTNGWGIGLAASDDGDLLTYIDHQSPRPSPEVVAQRIEAERAAQAQRRKKLKNIVDRMQVVEAQSTNQTSAANQGQQINQIASDLRKLARMILKQE